MFAAGPRPKPCIRAAITRRRFSTSDSTTAISTGTTTVPTSLGIDRQAEGEEEHRRERVAQRQHQALDAERHRALRQHQADHEHADRVGHAELLGDAGAEDRDADEAHGEELVVGVANSRPTSRAPQRASAAIARRKPSAVANWPRATTVRRPSPSTGCSTAR